MPALLLVTAVCRGDIALAYKRLDWMKELGAPQFPKDLLLVNDGSIEDGEFKKLAQAHVASGLFPKVDTRLILQPADKGEWPWTVNHVWRTTAMIVAGKYGLAFDPAPYYCWFYFEPDVTPLNKDFAHILEQGYLLQRRQFMGRVHATVTSDGRSIRHMNGAACYPMDNQWYNEAMMLTAGVPWDVAGMNVLSGTERQAEIPEIAYVVQVGAVEYKRNGQELSGRQTLRNGSEHTAVFTLDQQTLHHGCKDGSLIDALRLRTGTQGEPAAPSLCGHEIPGPQSPREEDDSLMKQIGEAPIIREIPKKLHWKKLQKLDKLAPQVRTDLSLKIPKRITMRKFKLKREEMEYILSKNPEPCVSTK